MRLAKRTARWFDVHHLMNDLIFRSLGDVHITLGRMRQSDKVANCLGRWRMGREVCVQRGAAHATTRCKNILSSEIEINIKLLSKVMYVYP